MVDFGGFSVMHTWRRSDRVQYLVKPARKVDRFRLRSERNRYGKAIVSLRERVVKHSNEQRVGVSQIVREKWKRQEPLNITETGMDDGRGLELRKTILANFESY